jgi:hypothetical protein
MAGARAQRTHRQGGQGSAGDVGGRGSGRFGCQGLPKVGFLSSGGAIEPKHAAHRIPGGHYPDPCLLRLRALAHKEAGLLAMTFVPTTTPFQVASLL